MTITLDKADIISARVCPYCGSHTIKIDSAEIYGTSYGMVYACSQYPACDAFVGCHGKDGEPLGRLANRELRHWKKNAHAVFDQLWKQGGMKRGDAYYWLSQKMDIHRDECHIGMFDVEQCKRVVQLCRERRGK